MAKVYALVVLAIIALAGPLLEISVTGHLEPFGKFDLAETFLSIPLIYYWYYVDKDQRQFRAGPILNAGVIVLAVIALPVYFIRSRGWKQGGISILKAAGVLAALVVLEFIGEAIGNAVAS